VEDAAAIAGLTTQLDYPVGADEQASRLGEILDAPDEAVLVAVDDDDRPIGWVHVGREHLLEQSHTATIRGLVVHEGYRSAGIGHDLMQSATAWARQAGALRLTLRSRISRERAHRFYEREGFARVKTSYVFEKRL
jgi:GNAT superfamily N-acetyltransferase